MFSLDLFFPNCAQGSIICTRFLINHLPFPPDFFSRLYNSPRSFNSPQPSHSFPSLFTIHSTTIHSSPVSVGGMLNTVSLLWLLRDDTMYDIITKAIYVHRCFVGMRPYTFNAYYVLFTICHVYEVDRPPLWSSGHSSWLQIQKSRILFPAIPDFLGSSGSGTGSTQPREWNEELLERKRGGSGLENR
jgi:hypothetical protein